MRPALLITGLLMFGLQPAALRGQIPPQNPLAVATPGTGVIALEAESLLNSSIATHGRVARQNMRPFGPGWSRDEQLFWSVAQLGAQLRLTFKTAVAGRYQVFLLFTRAPDYAFARASFDGAPWTSFNGYAPTVSRDSAFLGMLDLTPGVRELLVEVARKDGKSTGLYVGLDRIELRPVAARDRVIGRSLGSMTQEKTTSARVVQSQNQPVAAQAGQVAIAGARLAFAQFTADGPQAILGAIERTVYRPDLTVSLTWQANDGGKLGYRWQVAKQPFPSGLGVSATPPGLLGEGPAILDHSRSFQVPLGNFPPLATSPVSTGTRTGTARAGGYPSNGTSQAGGAIQLPDRPVDFYIRIIPILDDKPVGPPSSVVIAHFLPGAPHDIAAEAFANDAERKRRLAEMTEQAKVYQFSLVGFKPMVFEDPNRWGCVYLIKNPYAGNFVHPLGTYAPGREWCGKSYKGMGYQAENIGDVLAGWVKAYDIAANFYDDAKSFVAGKIAGLVPCEWLGSKLEKGCEGVAHDLASAAISAGLVVAGVPPTLPNLKELKGVAKGKVVDAAVEYSCKEFETHGGECTPEERKALATAYEEAIGRIQLGLVKATKEPGCGDTQAAHDEGREPLPCFSDYPGTDVRPATGAVTELPTVTIRVRRVKPNPHFPIAGCRIKADLSVTNEFPGAQISGVQYGPAHLQGYPFVEAETAIPALPIGSTLDVTLAFPRIKPFAVPGHYNATIWWYDWQYLYRGGVGQVLMSGRTATSVPGATGPNGKELTLPCAEFTQAQIQIPR